VADSILPGIPNEVALELAGCAKSEAALTIALAGETRAQWEQRQLDLFPRVDEGDVKRDWRYRMGLIAGLRLAAGLGAQAAKKIEGRT